MEITRLERADSTNTWVSRNESSLKSPSLVYCLSQTAGRGQRGNSWESEPGKNITASVLFHPGDFPANRQFTISEAVALAIVEYLGKKGVKAKVKWPNDIYAGDKKICGILVEHVVTGRNISRTIIGFGINLNQEIFRSDAPNPVSLKQLTGKEYDLEEEIGEIAGIMEKNLHEIDKRDDIHEKFLEKLWRKEDLNHEFFDRNKEEKISAKIEAVSPEGILTLKTDSGELREYAFKEVEFILSDTRAVCPYI